MSRVVLGVVVWLGVSTIAWSAARSLFPLPVGTFYGKEAEAVGRTADRLGWTYLLIYVVLSLIVFELAPRVWRRLRDDRSKLRDV